jgi:hypothetical protein
MGGMWGMAGGKEGFLSEKKRQQTFIRLLGVEAGWQVEKSFCFFFY